MYEQIKLLEGKVVCEKCNKNIDDSRNMRFFSDHAYDPECYFEIAVKELKDELEQEFILGHCNYKTKDFKDILFSFISEKGRYHGSEKVQKN